jgi:hypothetical protein
LTIGDELWRYERLLTAFAAEAKCTMPRSARKKESSSRNVQTAKYDAHHNVLDKAYGAFADLRRQLADSKTAVAERTDLLNIFADCADSQRAFLLLEDYFEKLALARKDFPGTTWWPRMLADDRSVINPCIKPVIFLNRLPSFSSQGL